MALRIIKPPKPGKLFVTLAPTGYLFFSSRAVAELNITEKKGVLLAQDDAGVLHLKASDSSDPETFRVYVRKNGLVSVTCIRINTLLRRFGIKAEKSTRYALIEAEEDFYRIEGLKNAKHK